MLNTTSRYQSSQSNDIQDSIILTMDHGTYCSDINCPCHTDVEYHIQVTSIPQHDKEEIRRAFSVFGIVQ